MTNRIDGCTLVLSCTLKIKARRYYYYDFDTLLPVHVLESHLQAKRNFCSSTME